MFNPLSPAQVVSAVGRAARAGARADAHADEFTRGQLMSAYSASRHLAVELDTYEAEVRRFADDLAAAIDASGLMPAPPGLAGTTDPRDAGTIVCELLDRLRTDEDPRAAALRTQVRSLIVRLVDREVDLLEDGLAKR